MESFLEAVGLYLVSRGDFAVIAGVEGVVIWRLMSLLLKSMETRALERAEAEKRAHEAMSQRAAELERFAAIIRPRRGG